MAKILTDKFVLALSKQLDLANVSPRQLSVFLGFSKAAGTNAMVAGNLTMNPASSFDDLFSKYVMKHGRGSVSALNLRGIFLENEMKDCADFVKAELEKFNIPVPSDEDTLMERDKPVSLPNLPSGTPGEGTEAAGVAQTDPADHLYEEIET
ncbi:uncharacterized protein LOC105439118 [Strongylocentrotus purpuratus]|uniref:Uncharacterized protein n=1 Tax=Strongylocentrotus purpuratus TaxID=7668 RepID=A0A7M7HG46_STRPU|nr:uncharacterized protein LOC105439118 [Strongylocentrotus purpuratus]|eukprot:XP_011666015.1 PREDICTED: uncharacterized protein LOC105439118 [Strongylocentrotus purpuratus]